MLKVHESHIYTVTVHMKLYSHGHVRAMPWSETTKRLSTKPPGLGKLLKKLPNRALQI